VGVDLSTMWVLSFMCCCGRPWGEGVRAGERERVCGLIVASMSSLSLSVTMICRMMDDISLVTTTLK
jgi:hypothetical protein